MILGRRLVAVTHNRLFEFRLERSALDSPDLAEGYVATFPFDPSRLGPEVFRGGDDERDSLLARHAVGDLIGVIVSGARVVHRSAVQFGGTAAIEGQRQGIRLRAGECYLHYCETVPEHFGQGLYPAMLRTILLALRQAGQAQRVLIACRVDNTASVRGITKAGFTSIADGRTISVLGNRIAFTRWTPTAARSPVAR
jgi:RimJ/RimL family protein N-acetyltransferase